MINTELKHNYTGPSGQYFFREIFENVNNILYNPYIFVLYSNHKEQVDISGFQMNMKTFDN